MTGKRFKLKYLFYYVRGMFDAYRFLKQWETEHKELINSCLMNGLEYRDILNLYARPAIQARFGFTDSQMDTLYSNSRKENSG